jgi:hypothetical protein
MEDRPLAPCQFGLSYARHGERVGDGRLTLAEFDREARPPYRAFVNFDYGNNCRA